MTLFTFKISREYTIVEGFQRTYEAASLEEAQAMADAEADESNGNCPDDCSEDDGWATTNFTADHDERM